MTNPKDSVGAKKAPLRYVPPALMLEVSRIMENGANKYGPYNWREQPVSAVTYVEAALRHLFAWMDRQDNAEDSGLPHLAHAAASLGILLDAIAGGNLIDDRYTAGPAADILRRLDQSDAPGGLPCPGWCRGTPEDHAAHRDSATMAQIEEAGKRLTENGTKMGEDFIKAILAEDASYHDVCPYCLQNYKTHNLACPAYR